MSTACNFNEDATVNDGSCDFASCFSNDVEGCTNPMACNFDGEATSLNDGSCVTSQAADMGCTDANACNYDVTATINDGSCVMATTGYDCFGNCIADVDGDGVCDMDEVSGCTDMGANNYDPSATDNNGTCTYDTEGCMDVYACCNFNYQATTDNGSCDFGCYGCMNANACNFNVDATLHDAEDCTFIMSHELQGAVDVVLEEATEYSYAFTAGSEYIWTVEGGVIVEGQGTRRRECGLAPRRRCNHSSRSQCGRLRGDLNELDCDWRCLWHERKHRWHSRPSRTPPTMWWSSTPLDLRLTPSRCWTLPAAW